MTGDASKDLTEFAAIVVAQLLADDNFIRELAHQISNNLKADGFVDEACLRIMVIREQQDEVGEVQAFVNQCYRRGVELGVNSKGKLTATNQVAMTMHLRDILDRRRSAITEFVAKTQYLEDRIQKQHDKDRARREAKQNGQPARATLPEGVKR